MTTTDPCRMGDRCRERDPAGGAAEAGPRGFCLNCERHGQHVIGQLPGDWLHLYVQLGKPLSSLGGGIGASAVEAPILLRVEIDQVMRHIVWTLQTWEIKVRRQARLSSLPPGRVRPHVTVRRAAQLLDRHYSVLLALGSQDYLAYSGQLQVGDGPAAIAEMVDLHYRSRSLAGSARRRERRALPCPSKEKGGCGRAGTLGEWIGDGSYGERIVDCSNCGWHCTIEQYTAYSLTFIPPGRRAAA